MASYFTGGGDKKRKQPEEGSTSSSPSITSTKEPAQKKIFSQTIAAAPVRYTSVQKSTIVPTTPFTPTTIPQTPLNFEQMEVTVPKGAAKLQGTTYQQALSRLDKKGGVQYVFPHLAPNKGQVQQTESGLKRFYRKAALDSWEDPTLTEWDPEDHRIFVGDLGNEVNDIVLFQAFSKYPSAQKAKVVRDKRSGKSRGFGFVSFSDPGDFAQALKEMNGKYIGNRPCKLRKSRWKDRLDDDKMAKQK